MDRVKYLVRNINSHQLTLNDLTEYDLTILSEFFKQTIVPIINQLEYEQRLAQSTRYLNLPTLDDYISQESLPKPVKKHREPYAFNKNALMAAESLNADPDMVSKYIEEIKTTEKVHFMNSCYTIQTIEKLLESFEKSIYCSHEEKGKLMAITGLESSQISKWFENRRVKFRKWKIKNI